MNKEELAKYYVRSIESSRFQQKIIESIINEIDNLTYKKTQKSIDANDKIWILEYIHHQLSSSSVKDGLNYIEKSADNKYYLILINKALIVLNSEKK